MPTWAACWLGPLPIGHFQRPVTVGCGARRLPGAVGVAPYLSCLAGRVIWIRSSVWCHSAGVEGFPVALTDGPGETLSRSADRRYRTIIWTGAERHRWLGRDRGDCWRCSCGPVEALCWPRGDQQNPASDRNGAQTSRRSIAAVKGRRSELGALREIVIPKLRWTRSAKSRRTSAAQRGGLGSSRGPVANSSAPRRSGLRHPKVRVPTRTALRGSSRPR